MVESYRLRLKKSTTGSRRVTVRLSTGARVFNADQTDEAAKDFPAAVVGLTEAEVDQYKADPNYEVQKVSEAEAEAAVDAKLSPAGRKRRDEAMRKMKPPEPAPAPSE